MATRRKQGGDTFLRELRREGKCHGAVKPAEGDLISMNRRPFFFSLRFLPFSVQSVPVPNMSYAYLFKSIVIGDSGTPWFLRGGRRGGTF